MPMLKLTPSLLKIPAIVATISFTGEAYSYVELGPKTSDIHYETARNPVHTGLNKTDLGTLRAALEDVRYSCIPTSNGWQAQNPGQRWITEFNNHGFLVTPISSDWTWGLQLESYGFGDEQYAVSGIPNVQVDEQQITYQWDNLIREWFINDQRGLEHGFILKDRPDTHSEGAPLVIRMRTMGSLIPIINSSYDGVIFNDHSGNSVLNYDGLKVWDADGKILASKFELVDGHTLRLIVDEENAIYPLTIDPIAQQAYIKPSTTFFGGYFGYSVAISGDTAVIGMPYENSSSTGINSTPTYSASTSGAAYVFVRNGNTWSQQAYLKASNTGQDDEFGYSVSISGDTIVVGARGEGSNTTGVNSTPNDAAQYAGAAYVFVRDGETWSQQAYLKASNTQAGDRFGDSVAIDGDTLAVGAYLENSTTTGTSSTPNNSGLQVGAVYVFVRDGVTWNQQAYLKASNAQSGDLFGGVVAISGDTIVAGAMNESSGTSGVNSTPDESKNRSGAAYVFTRSGTIWNEEAYLKASNPDSLDFFGWSVAVSGDTVVVGCPMEAGSSTGVNNPENNDAPRAGAAYVYSRSGSTWSQEAYIKASNTEGGDNFGYDVAVSGETIVISTPNEDSGTTGVDSIPDESGSLSGAAYVFVKNGGTWSQQSYLKASNTDSEDAFGFSIAISGDTLVVSATKEDSTTTGVDSTPNKLGSEIGAAYIFTGLGASGSGTYFSDWITAYPVGDQDGFNNDPDGDGNGNGLENFFGSDPSEFSQGLIAVSTNGGDFTFTHPQNDSPSDDISAPIYTWSMDLETFTPGGESYNGTTVTFSVDVDGGLATVTATVTGTPIQRLFVKVGVTQETP